MVTAYQTLDNSQKKETEESKPNSFRFSLLVFCFTWLPSSSWNAYPRVRGSPPAEATSSTMALWSSSPICRLNSLKVTNAILQVRGNKKCCVIHVIPICRLTGAMSSMSSSSSPICRGPGDIMSWPSYCICRGLRDIRSSSAHLSPPSHPKLILWWHVLCFRVFIYFLPVILPKMQYLHCARKLTRSVNQVEVSKPESLSHHVLRQVY